MAETCSTLSLGTRTDALTWENGCADIGIAADISIRKPKPSLAEIKSFFASTAEWLYFGGHFYGMKLYNEDDTVSVRFHKNQVELKAGGTSEVLNQSDAAFNLNLSSRVILWGGCSVCSTEDSMRTMRMLFGRHVLLGFSGLTGWRIVNYMLGGGGLKNHFYTRIKATSTSSADIVQAWMGAGKAGYGSGDIADIIRAVDWDGQEWKLDGGKIVKGRQVG